MEEAKRINFDIDFDFEDKSIRYCYFNDDRIEFLEFDRYVGPITLQYLPNGGIQSLFNYNLIIKVNNGFLVVTKLIYEKEEMSSQKFISLIGEEKLINQVLL